MPGIAPDTRISYHRRTAWLQFSGAPVRRRHGPHIPHIETNPPTYQRAIAEVPDEATPRADRCRDTVYSWVGPSTKYLASKGYSAQSTRIGQSGPGHPVSRRLLCRFDQRPPAPATSGVGNYWPG
ncbi:hypothetical protein GCM10027089_59320 [Nocardia thraciensis]